MLHYKTVYTPFRVYNDAPGHVQRRVTAVSANHSTQRIAMLTNLLRSITPVILIMILAGCAGSSAGGPARPGKEPAGSPQKDTAGLPNQAANGPKGALDADITNVLGKNLPARIDLLGLEVNTALRFEVPDGKLETAVPAGKYRAYIHVYDNGVPVLAEIQDVEITENKTSYLPINILEGASGALTIRDFDFDGDLAIDRVEIASGTDPQNAASIPGRPQLPYPDQDLGGEPGWYRGELYAHSKYGIGAESVEKLVKRAEQAGLDFLAITDRNIMAAANDPAFHSDKVILIPAMAWGNDELGEALIYGPRTLPDPPSTPSAAQAECIRVQAQGGLFAIAHPCFPTGCWKWGLSYVNAVQVWCRDWRSVPPLTLDKLEEPIKERKDGKKDERFIHSLAAAAADADLAAVSANTQGTRFWDYELVRGAMACAIAGSSSATPKVPLGRPVTYVRAEKKSLSAILEGLRLGRTFLSCGPDGPTIKFSADVMADNKIDVNIGGVVPLNLDVRFEVVVYKAAGKKLEVLFNGRPIITKTIEGETFVQRFLQHPTGSGAYRVRVVGPAADPKSGFGPLETYAMTSPIYAQNITTELLWRNPKLDVNKAWVEIKPGEIPQVTLPENLPPTIQTPQ